MKRRLLSSLLGATAALALTFAFALRGEEAPPPAPAAPATEQPAAPPAAPAAAQPATEQPAAPAAAQPLPAPAAPAPEQAQPAPAAPTPSAPATEAAPGQMRRLDTPTETTAEPARHARHGRREGLHITSGGRDNAQVNVLHDTLIAKGEHGQAAVSIFGSTTVDGELSDAAVSVMGNTTVNGSVDDAAVSVMGSTTVNGSVGDAAVSVGGTTTVNGHVHDAVVAVGGNVKLGPDAVVDGDVVVVGGGLEKDPGAEVHGQVQQVRIPAIGGIFAWVRSALFKFRLLSLNPAAAWAWLVALVALGFYLLLALIFPRAMTRCAETLEQRPGHVVLTALIITLAAPIVFVLLAITGVGALVIPVLGICLFVARLFGRGAMLAWIGRRFEGLFGPSVTARIALAVLIGGVVVMLLYLVPVVALIVAVLIGWLGLGTVVYTLIYTSRRNGKKPAPVAPVAAAAGSAAPVAPLAEAAAAGALPAAVVGAVPAAGPAAAIPPVLAPVPPAQASTLPRAGFWIRLVASFLDLILLSVTAAVIHVAGLFFLLFAAYSVVLWALKGTTIGGIICGLKVVRLDDRPVDWTVAIVRALAAFLSLAVVGLGFIWVAFDEEKQSWHDKIAGTTIVKMPKGVSLI